MIRNFYSRRARMRGRGPIQSAFQTPEGTQPVPQMSNPDPTMRPPVSGQGLPVVPPSPLEGLTVEPQQKKRNLLLMEGTN